ncbi:MFS transporter [Aeromicrobium phragmitis]|nr:MFS transporter [Aeromicrobium phragmitis]
MTSPIGTRGPRSTAAEQRKVLAGTMIGTTIEWYDFFIYANAAALVFAPLYFSHATSGAMAQIVAFMSVGISFFFRPLGAAIAGHLGDRIGRKRLLVVTLTMMGTATVLMGLTPTAAQIGVLAPLLLVLLRIVQGLSTGGEWGAAALMAVEHAPDHRRGYFGSFPQIGAAAGMLLATGALAIVSATTTAEQFMAWGWRLPFLGSIVLLVVGLYIRRRVGESPVFEELEQTSKRASAPIAQVLKRHKTELFQATWAYAGVNAAAYMVLGGYVLSYSTNSLGLDRTGVLTIIAVVNVLWIALTIWAGALSDRIGRVNTYKIGFISLAVWVFPMFLLIDTGSYLALVVALAGLAVGLSFSYGQQSAMYAEMFPAQVRFTGASLGYALGSIIGGGFAPTIASALQTSTGSTMPVAAYLALWALIALAVVWKVKDRTGQDISAAAAATPTTTRG